MTVSAAADKLDMTRQNINKHLKQEPISENFIRLFKEKIGLTTKVDGKFHANAVLLDMGDKEVMNVPFVNQYAYAGYLDGYFDEGYIETLPKVPWIVDKEHKGKYISIEVKGDSMDDGSRDSYIEGDILLCREIKHDLWRSRLHIKKWDFVIVHKTKGITIKKITEHNLEQGTLNLHPLNEEYKDFEVQLNDVRQIFNVVQVKRKK